MGMAGYSLLLALGLGLSAPWWLWRMLTSGRYREGLSGRLGRVPRQLREAVRDRQVVWVHAVSVGEVLAVERLVRELAEALRAQFGAGWVIAVSTTTATGQAVARERLAGDRAGVEVFFFPLDFAFAVRRYMQVLRPSLVVLVESELWPRLLWECARARVPVAVVNARVSDRSFRRTMPVRGLWRRMAAKVTVFLAQGEESAGRLRDLGAAQRRIRVTGNLKYDAPVPKENAVVERLRPLLARLEVTVAGSTLPGEEELVLDAWSEIDRGRRSRTLVLAPRHPQRFLEVETMLRVRGLAVLLASRRDMPPFLADGTIVLLDTLGDLASVYQLGDVAFVGGSEVREGGHNPLEPARYGVPVVIGESYENFREVVEQMQERQAIYISRGALDVALDGALHDGREMGERGRLFFEEQSGATARTVAALLHVIEAGA